MLDFRLVFALVSFSLNSILLALKQLVLTTDVWIAIDESIITPIVNYKNDDLSLNSSQQICSKM